MRRMIEQAHLHKGFDSIYIYTLSLRSRWGHLEHEAVRYSSKPSRSEEYFSVNEFPRGSRSGGIYFEGNEPASPDTRLGNCDLDRKYRIERCEYLHVVLVQNDNVTGHSAIVPRASCITLSTAGLR